MRIAIAVSGESLDARVDPRFGRAPYFLIVETEGMSFEAVANPHASRPVGAGVAAAEMLAGKGVQAVLAGVCGPNSFEVLSAAGIQVVTGAGGTAREAAEQFGGTFPTAPQAPPAVGQPAAGAPAGAGRAVAGAGMGRGWGGGMGRGWGAGMGGAYSAGPVSPEQEREMLGAQAAQLEEALRNIRQRLEELEREGEA